MPEPLAELRTVVRDHHRTGETALIRRLAHDARFDPATRERVADSAAGLVRTIRAETRPTLMESFLSEYGLSTSEGVGLMCLAEALLRVPDAETIDDLISDKIETSNWAAHLGHSSSPMVNASTWALMLTGKVLEEQGEGPVGALRDLVRRLGEPMVRTAVGQAMRMMGRQFVLGQTISAAMERAEGMEKKGYSYSYDMLGEAARTHADAHRYAESYAHAIDAIARRCSGDIRTNPGISVKLSALHPRYEHTHRRQVMTELVPVLKSLARRARDGNMGFNIDAEEADRLDISLDVIEATLADPALAGWDGFGVVVQAYGRRAAPVLDWLFALAEGLDRRIMVRLVKGAYWDTEIKKAQEQGVEDFPVFTRKVSTDVSYIANARKLLAMTDRIYPQFATHNAHTVAAVLDMAGDTSAFEFQRLHGMGEALHEAVRRRENTRCRIYAPVGAHRDLLAYLVRRLLENGANSSFVNQIVDEAIPPAVVARDPFADLERLGDAVPNPAILPPPDLFAPARRNSRGYDVNDPVHRAMLDEARGAYSSHRWMAMPMIAGASARQRDGRDALNPAKLDDIVGAVTEAVAADVDAALDAARAAAPDWAATPVADRAAALRRTADLYEANTGELLALATREAGKTLLDGIAEIREAVDFLRYYADEAERVAREAAPRGVFVCISPWNFPLAIFTGQIAAALGAGNAVVAKPAEQTPLIAARAVELMREAGVPDGAIQLLPGDGPTVGGPLSHDPRVDGVCFTGSTDVAQLINRAMAENLAPDAPLIAETGGLNAMIVDSTALPEQAVRDIVASAFQSAGQRCSALRILYVQEDVADRLVGMLEGAMDALTIDDPWDPATDVGPVIDEEARSSIAGYCDTALAERRLAKVLPHPDRGRFVAPAIVRIGGIADMEREIFGPVLHLAMFRAADLAKVVDDVNARGYGLTFGLHTRIDDRVQAVVETAHVGNLYVNRNQIGAIVGSQPFGGEGLSGTGPKAGGPLYVQRFLRGQLAGGAAGEPSQAAGAVMAALASIGRRNLDHAARLKAIARALGPYPGEPVGAALAAARQFRMSTAELPGPTGESNRYSRRARGPALCLGPDIGTALAQAVQALAAGCSTVVATPGAGEAVAGLAEAGLPVAAIDGTLDPVDLTGLADIAVVASSADEDRDRAIRIALAARPGPIVGLVREVVAPERYVIERHLCIDTTAAGGNASLLAASETDGTLVA